MKTLQFRCTLKSDVILNQKAATEGPNKTLDFIPGSCFLGIVASELYPKDKEKSDLDYEQKMKKAWEIFHSGKVRFGDAHPSKGDVRGLRIPASMFYPKLSRISDGEVYIHHAIPDLDNEDLKKKLLKQCRSGFYTFVNNEAKQVTTETNFALKSAYDNKTRRSKDAQLFGYESLQEGLELRFEVVTENDNLTNDIKEALVGKKRVGRSRTAQYGLVEITFLDDKEIDLSTNETTLVKGKRCVTIYADGRLIFLDGYGLPTFRPGVKDLGLPENATILWDKSQIRTFQYAPWNFTRQCFDTDRCGIEKGSVFVVDVTGCSDLKLESKYIGLYNNEGFGKVIYNPKFLKAQDNGIALCQIASEEKKDNEEEKKDNKKEGAVYQEIINLEKFGSTMTVYLAHLKKQEKLEMEVFDMVNDWVEKYWKLFRGGAFASQWGTIRSIAMMNKTKQALGYELFDKTVQRNGKSLPDAYLTHGVAADKWNERGRRKLFKEFFDHLDDDTAQLAIINLAAEMAKKCRKEDN